MEIINIVKELNLINAILEILPIQKEVLNKYVDSVAIARIMKERNIIEEFLK